MGSTDESKRKRRKLTIPSITASQNHHFHHHVRVPQGRRKRPLSPQSSPPVIKPCIYLMTLFQNKDIQNKDIQNKDIQNTTTTSNVTTSTTSISTRIDSFSIKQ